MMSHSIKISICSSVGSPLLLLYGVVIQDNKVVCEFPHYYPYIGEWGHRLNEIDPISIINGKFEFEFLWYSIYEDLFYQYKKYIDISSNCDTEILWGFKSGGAVACWEYNDFASKLIGIDFAKPLDPDKDKYLRIDQNTVNLIDPYYSTFQELKDEYNNFLNSEYKGVWDNFNYNINDLIKHYNFKYNCKVNYFGINIGAFELNVKYSDGSFNKKENEFLIKSGALSIPQRLNLRWSINSIDFQVCFFLNFESTRPMFDRFYGAHPETKTDFIIRIDVENKKYELALYRQGLKESIVIPVSAYQLIVFKNKFEDYRSENFNQPRGAWIW